ncbi:hypothetical protein NDU88_005862 [Pleurodeles waltl]|uniref:Uncharacterized protein n=1 Tax=Pleurodeles waltl TaxID=8319 RepID=A0AAV7WYA3_PLEWA|nr:hypothetical protein NDU88_005862 [Pleurodeles waltl]
MELRGTMEQKVQAPARQSTTQAPQPQTTNPEQLSAFEQQALNELADLKRRVTGIKLQMATMMKMCHNPQKLSEKELLAFPEKKNIIYVPAPEDKGSIHP